MGVSLNPAHSRVHEVAHKLGITGYSRGEHEQALKWLMFSVESNPSGSNIAARYDLGAALSAQGKKEAGIEMYRKVLEIDPGHIPTLHNLYVATDRKEGRQATKEELEALQAGQKKEEEAHDEL